MYKKFKDLIRWLLVRLRNPNTYISSLTIVSLDSKLHKGVKVFAGTQLSSCEISSYTYIGTNCNFARTTIGSFSSIGSEVICGIATHPLNFVSTYPGFYSKSAAGATWFGSTHVFQDKPAVTIGADVWIGTRAIILGGVQIGHGAVVGAGAIVTRDVPPYAIAVGVPAKIIKYRFSENIIEKLLQTKWWEMPDEKLKVMAAYVNSPENFISELEKINNMEDKNQI